MMKPGRKTRLLDEADKVLNESRQGDGWPTDLMSVISCAHITLQCVDDASAFDGRFEYLDGLPLIILNLRGKAIDSGRVRFTLGHELAHYCLHRRLDPNLWKPHDDNLELPAEVSEIEEEANFFSSCLLFPRPLVRQFLKHRIIRAATTAELSRCANASIQASAIAIAQTTSARCLFLYEDGTRIKWTAASDEWRESKLPWSSWKDKSVPAASAISLQERGTDEVEDPVQVWCPNHVWKEGQIVASSVPLSVGRMIVLNCSFDGDESLEEWDD